MLPLFYFEHLMNDVIVLDEETSRHVVQVLRMKAGEKFQLTDGKGMLSDVEITDDHKKKCAVKVLQNKFQPAPDKKNTVAISLLKNANRLEWFLEKATEIGVTEIIPLLCERTEKQHFRSDRMNGIIISAMLQSHQCWKPLLQEPVKFSECIKNADQKIKLIAHCADGEKEHLKRISTLDSNIILIGPEGDFTAAEIELAKSFTAVSLGDTRLRTETAGIVASVFLCS